MIITGTAGRLSVIFSTILKEGAFDVSFLLAYKEKIFYHIIEFNKSEQYAEKMEDKG